MSTEKGSKINKLLASQPKGIVFLASWMVEEGYSLDLQRRYRNSGWLESIGSGAMIRSGDTVDYDGAVYALQHQKQLPVHIGGKTALSLLGKAHYLDIEMKTAYLFGAGKEKLPKWFKQHDWITSVEFINSSFLPKEPGLIHFDFQMFPLKISGAARAIMECIYTMPQYVNFLECYQIMEGLNNLQPSMVQRLLEECNSIKVKRAFLFMAERAGHAWFHHLDCNNVDLGSGNRSLVDDGRYVPKYKITVPQVLIDDKG